MSDTINNNLYDMQPQHLNDQEVKYELTIRGYGVLDHDVNKKCLRRLLAADQLNKEKNYKLPKNIDLASEKTGILASLEEISELLDQNTDIKQNIDQASSKLCHVIGRLSRLSGNGDIAVFKAENLTKALALEDDVNVKRLNIIQLVETSSINPVSTLQDISTFSKGTPVHLWNIKFNGNFGDTSLNSFLERIEELRVARNISKQELFNSAVDIFAGPALIWYRSVRSSAENWEALVSLLKRDFLPPDYDSELWQEIRNRKQGSKERVAIYVAVMKNLFSRLSVLPTESEQLSIIKKNLQLNFRAHLALLDITSLEHMAKLCSTLEQSFGSDTSRSSVATCEALLEPDLKYCEPIIGGQDERRGSGSGEWKSGNGCWNCGRKEHRWSDCKDPRRKFCFKCGRKDVTVRTCSKCNAGNLNSTRVD